MCGEIKIRAKSIQDAYAKFNENPEDFPLPNDNIFVDGSYRTSFSIEELVNIYQAKKYNS